MGIPDGHAVGGPAPYVRLVLDRWSVCGSVDASDGLALGGGHTAARWPPEGRS